MQLLLTKINFGENGLHGPHTLIQTLLSCGN